MRRRKKSRVGDREKKTGRRGKTRRQLGRGEGGGRDEEKEGDCKQCKEEEEGIAAGGERDQKHVGKKINTCNM